MVKRAVSRARLTNPSNVRLGQEPTEAGDLTPNVEGNRRAAPALAKLKA